MRTKLALIVLLLGLQPVAAQAANDQEALATCLVAHSTPADQVTLAQWVALAMLAHPSVGKLARFSEEDKISTRKAMASTIQRLIVEDCGPETRQAIKSGGQVALQGAFEVMGKVAMTALMQNEETKVEAGRFAEYLDKDAVLKALVGAD